MARNQGRNKVGVTHRNKNRIRGIIGAFRDRSYDPDNSQRGLISRLRLQKSLLEARTSLSPDEYDTYLEWLEAQTSLHIPELRQLPVGFGSLSGIIKAPPAPLVRELQWVASRLALSASYLSTFRTLADAVERAIWHVDSAAAATSLDQIENSFGQSIWLIRARISVLQLFEGLEAQKKYTDQVKSQYHRGLIGYIAHYWSVRNEPSGLRLTKESA